VNTPGDSVSVRAERLEPPGAGNIYVVWLSNTANDALLKLGTLTVDGLGDGALAFTDPEGRMLPAFYNGVMISVEESGFDGGAPAGEIRYRGSVLEEVPAMLYEIFVASRTESNPADSAPSDMGDGTYPAATSAPPGESLLASARAEARTAAQHAGLAAGSTNMAGVRSHSEHTINILKGETEDYDLDGRGTNPGRGEGVYPLLDQIATLEAMVDMDGVSIDLQRNAEYMRICLLNTRMRVDRVIELEMQHIAAEDIASITAQLAESAQVAAELQTGVDLNQNGQIEAFEGECGLDQMEAYAFWSVVSKSTPANSDADSSPNNRRLCRTRLILVFCVKKGIRS